MDRYKSAEPVSKSRLKLWPPIVTGARYSESLCSGEAVTSASPSLVVVVEEEVASAGGTVKVGANVALADEFAELTGTDEAVATRLVSAVDVGNGAGRAETASPRKTAITSGSATMISQPYLANVRCISCRGVRVRPCRDGTLTLNGLLVSAWVLWLRVGAASAARAVRAARKQEIPCMV